MTEPAGPAERFFPVSLDVQERPCLVVGGGKVAARKARALLACGALVTVIAPSWNAEIEALLPSLATGERRPYRKGDASAFRLVVTATGVAEVDAAVYDDADAAGVWVNCADDRAHSSFILPAVHRDGAVTVAVSTGGLSPALAAWLRTRLAVQCGNGLGTVAELLAEARARFREEGVPSESIDWASLLDGDLVELVQAGDVDDARTTVSAFATRASGGPAASPRC
jgi:siroheme synthase-like protein